MLQQTGDIVMWVQGDRLDELLGRKSKELIRVSSARDPGRFDHVEIRELHQLEAMRKLGAKATKMKDVEKAPAAYVPVTGALAEGLPSLCVWVLPPFWAIMSLYHCGGGDLQEPEIKRRNSCARSGGKGGGEEQQKK